MRHVVLVRPSVLVVLTILAWMGLSQPRLVAAQEPAPLARLEIALWPEYDRPALLVILRGTLADEVPLPARVQLDLPLDVPALHAVAYLDESRQTLVDLPDFQFDTDGDSRTLRLTTPARQFHVEYYSDDLIKRQGAVRSIAYAFTATVAVADLLIEVQQPVGSSEFDSNPRPDATETRGDGLTYASYRMGALAGGDSRRLQVTYRRTTDALTVPEMPSPAPSAPSPPVLEPSAGAADNERLLWIVGTLIVVAIVGGVAFSLGRRSLRPPTTSRRERATDDAARATHCHRCGTRLRADGAFCHVCGTARREE